MSCKLAQDLMIKDSFARCVYLVMDNSAENIAYMKASADTEAVIVNCLSDL